MGADAVIYLETKEGKEPELEWDLPEGYRIVPADLKFSTEGATHEIEMEARYYGKDYARGPWPRIAAVLMLLLASEDIKTVWYGSDSGDGPDVCTPEMVNDLSAHFMANGNRGYGRI